MYNSKRSHRRVRMLAMLSIFVLLTSVFSWLPATAQEGTPDPVTEEPAQAQSLQTDESQTGGEGPGDLQTQDTQTGDESTGTTADDPPPAISVDTITIACSTAPGVVEATVSVSNARADAGITVQLLGDTSPEPTPLGEPSIQPLFDGQASYLVNLPLKAGMRDIAEMVSVEAFVTGDESTAVRSATSLPIYTADGVTLCGTPPNDPDTGEQPGDGTATATATTTATTVPSETATATATSTTTATATATTTATATATSTAIPTQYATVVNTSGANLRCRTAPVSGDTITLLAPGSRVELRGPASSGWYPVKCAGRDGYASADYLKADATPGTPAPGGEAGTATVRNTGGVGLRCRTAPVSGNVITVLADGTRVPLRGAVQDGWAPVTCASQAGWISTQYALIESGTGSTPSPTPSPTPDPGSGTGKYGTVINTGGMGLRCRTEPVSGAIITVVAEGTKLETRGAASNGWYPVKCGGQAGWVSGDYFTLDGGNTTPPPTSGGSSTATVSGTGGGGLRCRTAPVDGAVITVMPEGSRVETRGKSTNGWTPVKCAGQDGWASSAYLLFDVAAGSGELWMDVNLSTQYMRVYRGNTVIMQTYVSTGRPGFDTPTGTFYINRKIPSQTMSGVLGGEYYYVPNVPWVMYFTNRGHAIHGAYWHNNFGRVMSHGCINLPVSTAEWLYSVTPIGARVRIHY